MLVFRGLESDAIHRAGGRAEITCHAAFFSVRIAAQDDAAAPAWRDVGLLVRVLDRLPAPEHMQKDDPHCFQGIPHVISLLYPLSSVPRLIVMIPMPVRW